MTPAEAPGLLDTMARSPTPIRLRDIQRGIADLACVPLLLARGAERIEMPDPATELCPGEILFAGSTDARRQMFETLRNATTAGYVITGRDAAIGPIGRFLRLG